MPAIVCHNVSKAYDQHWAVRNLDLQVPEGTVFALVGPNGAGKSSTMKMMATLLEPTAGSVLICGKDVTLDQEAARSLIGYLPDHFVLYDDMTVERCLSFYGACYSMTRRDRARRIGALLDMLNLSTKAQSPIKSLSRGMKQRVGIARALFHDPPVLLLDEPASGLDPAARMAFRQLVLSLKARGKTVLVSSHILTELSSYCGAIAILQEGRVLESGTIGDVQARLGGGRLPYTLTFHSGIELAKVRLGRMPDVGPIVQDDNTLQFAFAADDARAAELLKALIEAGAAVVGMDRGQRDLEWLYGSISDNVVS